MAMLVVKAHLSRTETTVETRRFTILKELVSSPDLFKTVFDKIGNIFTDLENKNYSLMWKDSDGDFVLMSTDEEINDAFSALESETFQVYIQVDGEKEVKQTKLTETSKPVKGHKATKEDERQDVDANEYSAYLSFGCPPTMMGVPPPPPPPPSFPFHCGQFPWPGTDASLEQWHGHHPHMGRGMAFHGGPMGPGPWGMRQRKEKGHPFGHHHHGPRFGHHHHGPRFGHHHHGPHHHYGNMDNVQSYEDCKHGVGWKTGLVNAVPRLHRQWAKAFIQKWRQEYLANATTTTSDNKSDDGLTTEKAGVPEAYKKWLINMLPSWHRKWGADKVGCEIMEENDNDVNKNSRQLIKKSVPKEFRQWVKWFMQRHFGQRQAPKFKGDFGRDNSCHGDHVVQVDMNGKKRKRKFKMQVFASLVPASHRVWAKKYIHEWRVHKNLESLAPGTATTSESDDVEASLEEEEIAVPDDYGRWLDTFLPRWHSFRGFIERSEAKGRICGFKDTVPMDFRAWVKCHLCQKYGRLPAQRVVQQEEVDDTLKRKYRAWLKIFKNKWLQVSHSINGDSSVDYTILTSDDEGEAPNNGQMPDKSFKRLRISDDETGTQQRSVQFDPATYSQLPLEQNKMQKNMMDSDDSPEEIEIRKCDRKFPINHGIRKWVWQELDNWNGHMDSSTDVQASCPATEGAEIPFHVYQWMFKVMRKLEMKRGKQQMKAAKREMKASQKLDKVKAKLKASQREARFDD